MPRSSSPIDNQVLTLTIAELGGLGDGVAFSGTHRIIIPGGLPGDKVEIAVTGKNKHFWRGKIRRILTPGPTRQTAPCRHFTECGGCSFQHMQDDAYYAFKAHILTYALERAGYSGKPESGSWPLIKIGPASRRRVTFTVKAAHNQVHLGFFAEKSHRFTAIPECQILEPELAAIKSPLEAMLSRLSVVGALTTAAITLSDTGPDILLSATQGLSSEDRKLLAEWAESQGIARIAWRHNDVITFCHQKCQVEIRFGAVSVPLPPGAFLQATQQGQEAITQQVMEATASSRHIVDLYAGCGTYSFPLALRRPSVLAIEGDAAMASAMGEAAQKAGLTNIQAQSRDLFTYPLNSRELAPFDSAVINPPRNGAEMQIRELAKSTVSRIVMVSCNPITFSRDAAILREGGFALIHAAAIDQFYWTEHLEVIGVFQRQG